MVKHVTRPTVVDGVLKEWGDRYDLREPNPKGRKAKGGPRPRSGTGAAPAGGGGLTPRANLQAIAKRTPQAVFKITGGGKGSKAIAAHMRYISRHGRLELEDQDGQLHAGKGSFHDVIERWEYSGSPVPAESKFREAFNIVLSSPKGSDAAAVQRAAREFAQEQFGGHHDYVMALHAPETDPSAKPSENVHVHLVVKARSHAGVRLNPRKADLHAYRQAYARHLRANGIDVIAVKREALFRTRQKGVKQSLYQMKKRGATPRNAQTARTQETARLRALAAEDRAREIYGDVVAALATSQVPGDARLAESLRQVLPQLKEQQAKKAPPRTPAAKPGRRR